MADTPAAAKVSFEELTINKLVYIDPQIAPTTNKMFVMFCLMRL